MRILVINDWTPTGGGTERYLELVIDTLRRRGDDVRVLAAAVGDGAASDYPVATSDRAAAQAVLQLANPWAIRAARRAVRDWRPDVALVVMFEMRLSPAVIRALGRVPFVLSVAYYKPICPTGLRLLPDGRLCEVRAGRACLASGCLGRAHWLRDQVRYALIRREIDRASAVFACSAHLRDELAAAGITAEVAPFPARPAAGVPQRRLTAHPTFLYAGRFAPEKGIETLVAAFAQARASLPGARLRLVGGGPLERSLGERVAELGLGDAVDMLHWCDHERLDMLMEDAWAVVVPSLWAEPLGLVALDATVRRVPVVASDAGGLREIVQDGVNGILVPRGEVAPLAEALVGIGSSELFPTGSIPVEVAARVAGAHDAERYVTWLRRRLEEVA
ncbi:MAG: glycosyltransferase family 4 protein [Thermoleophilia bacterium]